MELPLGWIVYTLLVYVALGLSAHWISREPGESHSIYFPSSSPLSCNNLRDLLCVEYSSVNH